MADHLALGAADRPWLRAARHRRLGPRQLGHLPPRRRLEAPRAQSAWRPSGRALVLLYRAGETTRTQSVHFATKDDSKNTWWAALITFGEGWHNNHHAHPTSARHGLAWYEFDPTWLSLKLLRAVGLVWDVKVAKISQIPADEAAA